MRGRRDPDAVAGADVGETVGGTMATAATDSVTVTAKTGGALALVLAAAAAAAAVATAAAAKGNMNDHTVRGQGS